MATIDFEEKVIKRSFEVPVVVDFWAAWCGPCRVLGPVITEMSKEAAGKWELVKVDTEANREIAQQYQIMSIPNVKMFHKGEMVAEFAGALPKLQIQQWLDEHLPNPQKEEGKKVIEALLAQPSLEKLEALKSFSQAHSAIQDAQVYIHWFEAIHGKEQTISWLQQQSGNAQMIDIFNDIKTLLEVSEANPTGSEGFVQSWTAGIEALKELNMEDAMKHFVQSLMVNKKFQDELPRRLMISLFHLLGETHPLTKKYRPMFSMALY
ncbi:MAG: thioredoxin [Bacteroidota bacterium]